MRKFEKTIEWHNHAASFLFLKKLFSFSTLIILDQIVERSMRIYLIISHYFEQQKDTCGKLLWCLSGIVDWSSARQQNPSTINVSISSSQALGQEVADSQCPMRRGNWWLFGSWTLPQSPCYLFQFTTWSMSISYLSV